MHHSYPRNPKIDILKTPIYPERMCLAPAVADLAFEWEWDAGGA